jgi:prevent-host-death family protein
MDRSPGVVPVTDVRRDIAHLIEEVNRSARPVFISQRGYLTAVLLSCDRYDSLRHDASVNERMSQSTRSLPRVPFRRTQYGPCDYETARLFSQEGYETEFDEIPEGWLPGE